MENLGDILKDLIRKFPSDSCLLCGDVPTVIGIYSPNSPEKWGAIKGKGRIFRYCLCEKCKSKSGVAEDVEKVIWSDLSGSVSYAE